MDGPEVFTIARIVDSRSAVGSPAEAGEGGGAGGGGGGGWGGAATHDAADLRTDEHPDEPGVEL